MTGSTGVRQIGFQETPIVEMVAGITKCALKVHAAGDLRRVMEEAYWTATHGRQGPVLVDVPDNIQREEIDWDQLEGFAPPQEVGAELSEDLLAIQSAIAAAERPVLVAGAGVVLAGAEASFREFAEAWGAPVALTWGAAHVLPSDHPLSLGTFGTHGSRHANFAIQNADLVLAVGSRLDTKATGSPVNSFARLAKKIMVDVDSAELSKFRNFGMTIDLAVRADAATFLEACSDLDLPKVGSMWVDYCGRARAVCEAFDRRRRMGPGISPYEFMAALGASSPEELDVFVDTGCALPWTITGFPLGDGQRLFHDFNNTAMGWALPATIGASVAAPERSRLCVIGDGSLMMAMQDLVTYAAISERARIVLLDNSGYAMIQQTQDQWLESSYHSSSIQGGLRFPNYEALAEATGFSYLSLEDPEHFTTVLAQMWRVEVPVLLRVRIDPSWRVVPQVRFGRPNEDMEPLLPRESFRELMIVPPMSASLDGDE